MKSITASLTAGALIAASTLAQAQTPQRTDAIYGDWTVRCDMSGTPPQKSCVLMQAFAPQAQNKPSAVNQILITRRSKAEATRLVVEVQPFVAIETGLKLTYDPKQPPLALPFSRCFPNACFASIALNEPVIARLHARTEPGRIDFKDAADRDVAVAVSFKGFATAYDVWLRE